MTERERLNEQLTNLLQNYRHAPAGAAPLTQAYRAMLAASPQASDETKAAKGE